MKNFLIICLLFFTLANAVEAKWATIDNAPIKASYAKKIAIKNDGSYEILTHASYLILNEVGRQRFASMALIYNGSNEKLEILEASTVYKGKKYPLAREQLEDKPLASDPSGFDQKRQMLLAFPKTEIGATICIKHRLTIKKPILDRFFGEILYFGYEEYVARAQIIIKSHLPLNIQINDPQNYLATKKTKSGQRHLIEIKLKKPIYKMIISEKQAIANPEDFTWIALSSLKNWSELATKYEPHLASNFSQKLPRDFKDILRQALQKKSELDQINIVTTLLATKIRYMGDWRTIEGGYIPRKLNEISRTQMGDCKDFSAATAAILAKLGFKAELAIVMRGIGIVQNQTLPSFNNFNHMITKITGKSGTIYWIDPTNFVSMAGGIFPDIADKYALVISKANPSYEKIPPVDSKRALAHIKKELTIWAHNKISERGTILFKNEAALGLTGAKLITSEENIRDVIFYMLADGSHLDEKNKISMQLPKLDSRLVEDLSIDYNLTRENELISTNVGIALKLASSETLANLYNISQDYVSKIIVDQFPRTLKRTTIVKNVGAKNLEFLNKSIHTPWIDVERKCSTKTNDLYICDTYVLHRNIIPRGEFITPEFVALKNWLKDHFKDIIIVFEQIHREAKPQSMTPSNL